MRTRERAVAFALIVLAVSLAALAPSFFAGGNLRDLLLAHLPVFIVALGALAVILTGEIDISCGSLFAVCSVIAGIVATASGSTLAAVGASVAAGLLLGTFNGVLVAYARIPSIVVTLATMVAVRDALRWTTGGAWITDLPPTFQWFGLRQDWFPVMAAAVAACLAIVMALVLTRSAAGRWVYAVGSNAAAARLAGIHVEQVKCAVFAASGMLVAVAAAVNAARFNQVPSNSGIGLEMRVVAAVIVGGAAVTGGVGRVTGTLLGVALLALVGPALTFLGVTAYWERALQGSIILTAVAAEAWHLRARRRTPAAALLPSP